MKTGFESRNILKVSTIKIRNLLALIDGFLEISNSWKYVLS